MHYPETGEHALIVGQTGSGKTVMLQHLLRQADISPVFVLDTKIDDGFLSLNLPSESLIVFSDGLNAFKKYLKQPLRKIPDYVIIRPPASETLDTDTLDDYLILLHSLKYPAIIAVDELYMLHKSGRCGPGLAGILTRGRSKDQRLYGATQRPSWISRFCLSEPSHYYLFRLIDIEDRKKLTHLGYDKNQLLDKYYFINYSASVGRATLENPIPFTSRAGIGASTGNLTSRWI